MLQDEKFGTVTAWRKKEGQKISKGEDLCELEFTNFTMKTIFWTFKPPYRIKLLFDQMYFIGNKSIFIIPSRF